MQQRQYIEGFSEEKQEQYEREIRERYGEKAFDGVTAWNSYSGEQKARIQAESDAIYRDLAAILEGSGEVGLENAAQFKEAALEAAQPILARWHQHLRYFYEPTIEVLRGLGQFYCEHPDFRATFTRFHPALPEFLEAAIQVYCDRLPAASAL